MENNSKSKNKVALIVVAVVVAILVLLVVVAGIAGMNKDSSENKSEENTQASTETVASKVKKAIDGMSESSRDEMIVNNDGVGGKILNIDEGKNNIVQVRVSTPISQLATNDEGKDIATKVLVSVCKDVPELRGIDVIGDQSDSRSNIVLTQNFPICKQ